MSAPAMHSTALFRAGGADISAVVRPVAFCGWVVGDLLAVRSPLFFHSSTYAANALPRAGRG